MRDIRIDLDIYKYNDNDFKSSSDLLEIKKNFKNDNIIFTYLQFQKDSIEEDLCVIQDKLLNSTNNYKSFSTIFSYWSIRSPEVANEHIWYPTVLPNICDSLSKEQLYLKLNKQSFYNHFFSNRGLNDILYITSFTEDYTTNFEIKSLTLYLEKTVSFVKTHLKNVKAYFLGPAIFRYHIQKTIKKDSVYNIGIFIFLILFFKLFFGTWKSGIFFSFTIFITMIFLYGGLSFIGFPIDILTNNLFLMITLSALSDFIFVSENQVKNGNFKKSFKELITPCFFTTLTTVVGFLSLYFSDLSLIKRFGISAAYGALIEWIMVFIFLPCFLKVIKKDTIWVDSKKVFRPQFFEKIKKFKIPSIVLKFFLILMFMAVPSFFTLNYSDNPITNFPKNHDISISYHKIKDNFGWAGMIYLYFYKDYSEKRVSYIVDEVRKINGVIKVENPFELKNLWVDNLKVERKELILRDLKNSPLWGNYFSTSETLRIPIYLSDINVSFLRDIRMSINKVCNNYCRVAGQSIVYLDYNDNISRNLIKSFVVTLFLVLLIILLLIYRNNFERYSIFIIISALLGPLVTLTFMALFKIPINIITSIFISVMVGLSGDNAIHYIFAGKNIFIEGVELKALSSFLISLAMIGGSLFFFFQTLQPMKILGILFLVGFTINLTGDLFALKTLLLRAKK